MTDRDREAFDSYIVSAGTKRWGQEVYDEHWKTWQAARDHYSPKLTKAEAVEVCRDVYRHARKGELWPGIVAALRAAGMKFKEEA